MTTGLKLKNFVGAERDSRAPLGEGVAGSPHAIGQGTLVANSNYTIAFTPSVLMVTPAPLTITAEAAKACWTRIRP